MTTHGRDASCYRSFFYLHFKLYQLGWDASDDRSYCITKIAQLPSRLLMLIITVVSFSPAAMCDYDWLRLKSLSLNLEAFDFLRGSYRSAPWRWVSATADSIIELTKQQDLTGTCCPSALCSVNHTCLIIDISLLPKFCYPPSHTRFASRSI